MAALSDHVILLTGASEGIGRALALALAPQRLSLVVAARNAERLAGLARECETAGSAALAAPTDVSNEEQCRTLVDAAIARFFDSLRIELAGSGVSVTVIAPDFVRSEIHKRALGPDGRPLGESPMRQDHLMSAEECARLMVRAIEKRKRLLITSARGRLGRWLKLIAPRAIDALAAKAIRERR